MSDWYEQELLKENTELKAELAEARRSKPEAPASDDTLSKAYKAIHQAQPEAHASFDEWYESEYTEPHPARTDEHRAQSRLAYTAGQPAELTYHQAEFAVKLYGSRFNGRNNAELWAECVRLAREEHK